MALTAFEERWDPHFPMIAREWRANWANLTTFFDYPVDPARPGLARRANHFALVSPDRMPA